MMNISVGSEEERIVYNAALVARKISEKLKTINWEKRHEHAIIIGQAEAWADMLADTLDMGLDPGFLLNTIGEVEGDKTALYGKDEQS
jgi:hypothetical protein